MSKTAYKAAYCKKQTIETKKYTAEDIAGIVSSFGNGGYVLWLHHKVIAGKPAGWNISRFNLGENRSLEDSMVRLRIFNEKEEWHFWRTSNGISGRHRKDDETEENTEEGTAYIEANMQVRGVIVRQLAESGEGKIWYIKTRNYIDYNEETGQAGYVDSRFVEFVKY